MKRTDFVAGVPDAVGALFEPALPLAVWKGVGRKPPGDRECLRARLSIPVAGTAWEMLPPGSPSDKVPGAARRAGWPRV